mmetsp:Transcript_30999/g.42390  ORF Transcript_30999/g.42390 Transcript_30999/m.42390 type:complete len:206 (-) Transcript_30999:405-1022(-)
MVGSSVSLVVSLPFSMSSTLAASKVPSRCNSSSVAESCSRSVMEETLDWMVANRTLSSCRRGLLSDSWWQVNPSRPAAARILAMPLSWAVEKPPSSIRSRWLMRSESPMRSATLPALSAQFSAFSNCCRHITSSLSHVASWSCSFCLDSHCCSFACWACVNEPGFAPILASTMSATTFTRTNTLAIFGSKSRFATSPGCWVGFPE